MRWVCGKERCETLPSYNLPHENKTMREGSNTRTENIVLHGETPRLESTQQTTEKEDETVTQRSMILARSLEGPHLNVKYIFRGICQMQASLQGSVSPLARKKWKIGTWNVYPVCEGKLETIKSEMIHYSIAILGISEMRWKGCGYSSHNEFMVYHSGNEKN